MSFGSSSQFTTGRMLSVASSDDGQLVFAGSFSSNLWVSEDGGESWSQIQWPQPDAGQFGVPGAIGGYSHESKQPTDKPGSRSLCPTIAC
jgi:hypothetical protein